MEQRFAENVPSISPYFLSLDNGGDDRHLSHFFRGLARGETGDFRQVHGGGGEGEEGRGRRRRSHERRRGYATRPKLAYRRNAPMLNAQSIRPIID